MDPMKAIPWRRVLSLLALAAVYFIAGKLGLRLASVHESATAVWPPTGIGLAALLLLGYRMWPGVFLGAFLVNATTGGSWPTTLAIATGNTLEGLLGAFLVNRWAGGRRCLERPADVLRFALLGGLAASSVSATAGVTSLALAHSAPWSKFGSIWLTWWLGDVAGALIVAPLLLLWSERPVLRRSSAFWIEAAILLAILAGVAMVVFAGGSILSRRNYPLAFLSIPIVVWVAVRFGPRETATAVAVLAGIALWGTLRGWGPFFRGALNESLVILQAFMGVISVKALVLAAAVAERRKAQDELELRVKERTKSLSDAVSALQNEIAQRRRAEEDRSQMLSRLLQGQKIQAVGQLAAGIAHEINNPVGWTLSNLSVLSEYLEELERLQQATNRSIDQVAAGADAGQVGKDLAKMKNDIGPEALMADFRNALTDCKKGAERIRDIVRNLREFSHIDEGQLKPADPKVLLENSIQLCANELKYKATLHRDYGEVPPVWCYPQQIEQLLVNLLVNAAQSFQERGDIHIRSRGENGFALIQIRDTGCGIAPHHREKLFEPFFTTKAVGKGTGLGLYVAQKIILAHQGKIEVASEPGKGTEFSIYLPFKGPGGPPA
jgi:two-component system, NtrC family, sensor kinase